jgi:hypothetical protein
MFASPDSPLQQPIEETELPSLVASARRNEVIGAEIIEDEDISAKDRYPKMSKLSIKVPRRRITNRKNKSGRLRGSSVIAELVRPSLGRASNLTRKLFRRKLRTTDALRIQAENSRQSQLVDSIQNLAKSKGGDVSDEEVSEMMSHLSPNPVIPSSFGDLVSTEAKSKQGDNVASMPRLDD